MATCGAAGCDQLAVGIFCSAPGAAKTETELKCDVDERMDGKK